ncbi:MAG: hypothetical protein J7K81_09100, partial [Methanophagales archaeon]|nr:hypothetical protein [Methanophagales archaeon]
MQVLHAVWDGNKEGLFLWAESSAMPTAVPKSRGRKPKKPKIKTHPFALPATELRELIGRISDKTCLESAKFEKRTFLLPSTQKGPLPSPWLIRENEDDYGTDKATGLAGWNIEALSFEPYSAFVFLIGLPEQLPRGFAFGSSLRFWIEAAKFSLELIARQQFTPAIKVGEQEHDFRAAWEAVITEEDSERVQTLAEAMPPSCRAFSDKDKSQLPSLSPSDMVLSFINRTVDAFIRESLASTSLLPPRRGRRPKVVPLLEQWLSALSTSTENTALTAPAEVLGTFYSEIQAWLTQLQPAAPDAPFRTCFRLEPPSESESEEDGTNWDVRFFLQAKDDRSLLVPAEEVWKTRSSTLTFLKRRFENPQEQLLADLANASRAFPAIETSLQTARPEGLELNAEQAYSFLRESAPLLEQSGFGVLLPSWWEKPAARMGVKLKLKPASEKSGASGKVETSGVFGVGGIITYDWVVAIGDETLSEEEFEQLASLKVPLVQVRGQWVELRPEDVESAINFFKHKHRSGEMTLGEAVQLELGADAEDVETEVGLPVVEVEAEGWLEEMLGSLSGGVKVTPVKTPKTFNGKLRPYQVKGVSWLAYLNKFGLGACLADDMGLGKCVLGDTLVVVNGILQSAEDIWNRYAGEVIFDGEGFWTVPTERLRTNSIDSETGKIVQTNIKRLYRQRVCERLRNVRLEDGSSVTITYRHKLLTNNGWTNDLHNGDYVCVPAKIIWDGKSEDHDLVKFLAWQIAEGYEHRKQAMLSIAQKDTERLDDLRQIIIRISKKYKIKINSPAIRTYADKTPTLVINSREYERFLSDKEYSWGQLSRGKTIPPFIMQADLDSVRVFLQNYFDAEGSAVQSMRSIEISTASAMLIQQLSYLLRRFGIWLH